MSCRTPITIPRPSGKGFNHVPCGKCYDCLGAKRADWSFRLRQELKVAVTAWFLTLTYENAPEELSKRDCQLFLKRLREKQRKVIPRVGNKEKDAEIALKWKIRYFLTGEYGPTTGRSHYHMILFNLHPSLVKEIQEIWGHGFVRFGDVNDKSIHYVAKYCIVPDPDQYGQRQKPFALMSTRPAIGANYLTRMKDWHREDGRFYVITNGYKQRLPRFYKERIFDQKQREQHAKEMQEIADKAHLDFIKKTDRWALTWQHRQQESQEKMNKLIKKGKL